MSFLCTIRNKEVSYHQCVNECQYFFKSGCIDKMNEAYNQGRADALDELEPLFKLIVEFENSYICDEMCSTEYCEENCKYDCPQKECYLRYLDWIKEQK